MITITARDMLTAQAAQLTAEERAELVERCERQRRIITAATGYVCTDKQSILVNVHTAEGARIGYLTYWL
jgi:hypothetical protein